MSHPSCLSATIWKCAAQPGVVLSLLAFAASASAQDQRPTGYPRSANERPNHPVTVSAVYTADIRDNVDGGVKRGTRCLDNIDLQLAIDADRLIGWHGARLFAYGIYDNGVSISRLVGDVQTISNIETSVRAARLFEAWLEQDIGTSASIKAGLYNLNSEFDTTQSGGLFLISSHGIGPDFSQSGRNGPSIFPITSLAIRGEVKLAEHWLGRLAVLDGVPGDTEHPRRTAIKLSDRDGALIVSEVNYLKGGTKAAFGVLGVYRSLHLEHAGRLLAEHLLQLVVRVDLPPIFGVLQVVLFDVLPDLADDLAARQVFVADDLTQFRRGRHRRRNAAARPARRLAGLFDLLFGRLGLILAALRCRACHLPALDLAAAEVADLSER
jgi:hypothetical protein